MPERPDVCFEAVDIYYNYVFDLGRPVNPLVAGHHLLEASFGRVLCNPTTGETELATRFGPSIDGLKAISALQRDFALYKQKPNLRNTIRLVRHRPVIFGKVLLDAFVPTSRTTEMGEMGADVPQPRDSEASLDEAAHKVRQMMNEKMADLSVLLRLHERADQEAFSTAYLDRVPFVRVGLDSFHATLNGEKLEMGKSSTSTWK